MTKRSEEPRMSLRAAGKSALDDRDRPREGSEEIDDLPETGREDETPSPDEIRLRAYYRYMERQGGDDDEIADWLAAESELRQERDASRAAERKDERS
jgi:Protein of unknown function (DUF2934)